MLPKLLLAVFSFALSLVVGELGARLIWGPPGWTDQRVVFFSTNTWRRDPMGAMRYTPDATVRTVAIYGNQIEYDARFQVNNLGFIDRIDYETENAKHQENGIAFVGDSFTAGFHNNRPWVPRLRDRAQELHPEIEIYNLGVGAIGVFDFTRLAESAATELNFEKIVFLLITDDLNRKQWKPIERGGVLHLCPEDARRRACLSGPSRILVLDENDTSIDEMMAIIDEKGLIPPSQGILDWWTRNTFIGSRLRSRLVGEVAAGPPAPAPDMLERQFARWLLELQEKFSDKEIVLIHLPTKDDVLQGHFSIDAASQARSAGFEYVSLLEQCNLEIDDYFTIDGHPNDRGYQKILECVGSALDLI